MELREEFPGTDVREESLLDFDFANHAKVAAVPRRARI